MEHRQRFDGPELLVHCHGFIEMARGEDQVGVWNGVFEGQRPAFHDLPGNGDGFGPLAFAPQAVGAFAFQQLQWSGASWANAWADLRGFGAQPLGLRVVDVRGKAAQ